MSDICKFSIFLLAINLANTQRSTPMGIDIASALHSYCVEVESTKPIEAEKVSFGTIAESLQKGELTPLGPRLVRSEARSRLLAYYSDSPYSESWRAMGFGAQ